MHQFVIITLFQTDVNRKISPMVSFHWANLYTFMKMYKYIIIYYLLKKCIFEYNVFDPPQPAGVPCLKSLYHFPPE